MVIEIYNYAELQAIKDAPLSNDYILMVDIDCSGEDPFIPIGSLSSFYTGTFDGGKHTISNLVINETGYVIGLFNASFGIIKNLIIKDANVIGSAGAGILVGWNGGEIDYCSVINGQITGIDNVGGLVSYNSGNIKESWTEGTDISGSNNTVGGLIGQTSGGVIRNCYSKSNVSAPSSVGGIVGTNGTDSLIENCYFANGSLTVDYQIGGIAGVNFGGSIVNSYATGIFIYPTGALYIGGIVGVQHPGATITHCFYYNSATVCVGLDNGSTVNCSKVLSVSDFYGKSHEVYDNNPPIWDFVNIWIETEDYPILDLILLGSTAKQFTVASKAISGLEVTKSIGEKVNIAETYLSKDYSNKSIAEILGNINYEK